MTLLTLALGGCFSPADETPVEDTEPGVSEEDAGAHDESDSSTGGDDDAAPGDDDESSSSTGEPSDDSPGDESPADDDSGNGDALTLTVDGASDSTTVSATKLVELHAEAMDAGIEGVEFYLGEDLIAQDDEAPFTQSVLLSSADNGEASITAIGTGDVTSNSVELTVSISGGELTRLADDLGTARFLSCNSVPRVLATADETYLLAFTQLDTSGSNATSAITFTELDAQLEGTAGNKFPEIAGPNDYNLCGRPVIVGDSVVGAANMQSSLTLFDSGITVVAGTDGSKPDSAANFGSPGGAYAGATADGNGVAYVAASSTEVARLSENNLHAQWTEDVTAGFAEGTLWSIAPAADGFYATFYCGTECMQTRKVDSDGTFEWTREFTLSNDPVGYPAITAAHPGGGVVTVIGTGKLFQLERRGADGALLAQTELHTGSYLIYDATFDPQGNVVIAGGVDDDISQLAWIGRYTADGAELWTTTFAVDTDTAASGVSVSSSGKLVVAGITDGDDDGFFTGLADAWVAEIQL